MTRYSVRNKKEPATFIARSPDGNWVWYPEAAAEIEELQKEVERLNSVVAIRDQSRDVLVQLCDSLRSTVAELQKAINESIQDIQRLKSDNGDPVDQLFDKYISRLEKALNTARSAEKK